MAQEYLSGQPVAEGGRMRMAGRILGFVGGGLDAAVGLLMMVGVAGMGLLVGEMLPQQDIPSDVARQVISGVLIFIGVIMFVCSAVAIFGAVTARKNPVLGGILLILAGLPNFLMGALGFIIAFILIAGGVLVLVSNTRRTMTEAPPA